MEENDFDELEALEASFDGYGICDFSSNTTDNLLEPPDKMCIGLNNETLCVRPIDAGKGFYRKNPEDGRYYIYGVVTVPSVADDACMKKVLLTETSSYYDFFYCTLFRD